MLSPFSPAAFLLLIPSLLAFYTIYDSYETPWLAAMVKKVTSVGLSPSNLVPTDLEGAK